MPPRPVIRRRSLPYGVPQVACGRGGDLGVRAPDDRSSEVGVGVGQPADANWPPHHCTSTGCSRSQGSSSQAAATASLQRRRARPPVLVEGDAQPALGDEQVRHGGGPVAGLTVPIEIG